MIFKALEEAIRFVQECTVDEHGYIQASSVLFGLVNFHLRIHACGFLFFVVS